jgi:ribosomal protein L24
MILRGSLKGQTGKVLEIDKKRDKVHVQTETSIVQQLGQDDVSCLSH